MRRSESQLVMNRVMIASEILLWEISQGCESTHVWSEDSDYVQVAGLGHPSEVDLAGRARQVRNVARVGRVLPAGYELWKGVLFT